MEKFFYNLSFLPFFYLLSYLVPKDKRLVLLGGGLGYKFIGNTKYFYLWLLENKKNGFTYFWITRNQTEFKDLRLRHMPVRYLYSLSGIWSILRARWLVVEQSGQDIAGTAFLLGNFHFLQTWHGTPLKDISIDEQIKSKDIVSSLFKNLAAQERNNYTISLACSKESARHMKQAKIGDVVRVWGYPRDDIFFNKSIQFKSKQLEFLRKYKRIYLYAPTFRDHTNTINAFSQSGLYQLNMYLKKTNAVLLVRTHPLANDVLRIGTLSNVINVASIDDIQEILLFTDVLISDYSSLIIDFLLTQRPIIFYTYDLEEYISQSRKMYYDVKKDMIGPFAKSEKELIHLIQHVDEWSVKVDYKKTYRKAIRRFHRYIDGKSSLRLYNFISKIV